LTLSVDDYDNDLCTEPNSLTYTNTLHYKPAVTGLIVRELPFSMLICLFLILKFHRSYQVLFITKTVGGTVYRGLQTHARLLIMAMDASWNLLVDGQSFVLGKPICFEAKGPGSQAGKFRLCLVTSSPNPQSMEKYSVVENYGCLVDSKNSILTKNMVSLPQPKKTMFMHCELDFGPQTPRPSAKSCTYNTKTKKWTELYGDSTVCNCCAFTCPAPPVASGKTMITSESWNLKMGPETSSPLSPEESMPEFSLAGHDDFELFRESNDDY
uniref:Uncharacterized protein n=1 Tax=Sinocyclocheilus anshuiensis TaxID=1608454 RepID=A0A671S7H4_9TELE